MFDVRLALPFDFSSFRKPCLRQGLHRLRFLAHSAFIDAEMFDALFVIFGLQASSLRGIWGHPFNSATGISTMNANKRKFNALINGIGNKSSNSGSAKEVNNVPSAGHGEGDSQAKKRRVSDTTSTLR